MLWTVTKWTTHSSVWLLWLFIPSHNYSFHTFGLGHFGSMLGGKGSFLKVSWIFHGSSFSGNLFLNPKTWTTSPAHKRLFSFSRLLPYTSIVAIDVCRKCSLENPLGKTRIVSQSHGPIFFNGKKCLITWNAGMTGSNYLGILCYSISNLQLKPHSTPSHTQYSEYCLGPSPGLCLSVNRTYVYYVSFLSRPQP